MLKIIFGAKIQIEIMSRIVFNPHFSTQYSKWQVKKRVNWNCVIETDFFPSYYLTWRALKDAYAKLLLMWICSQGAKKVSNLRIIMVFLLLASLLFSYRDIHEMMSYFAKCNLVIMITAKWCTFLPAKIKDILSCVGVFWFQLCVWIILDKENHFWPFDESRLNVHSQVG